MAILISVGIILLFQWAVMITSIRDYHPKRRNKSWYEGRIVALIFNLLVGSVYWICLVSLVMLGLGMLTWEGGESISGAFMGLFVVWPFVFNQVLIITNREDLFGS